MRAFYTGEEACLVVLKWLLRDKVAIQSLTLSIPRQFGSACRCAAGRKTARTHARTHAVRPQQYGSARTHAETRRSAADTTRGGVRMMLTSYTHLLVDDLVPRYPCERLCRIRMYEVYQ